MNEAVAEKSVSTSARIGCKCVLNRYYSRPRTEEGVRLCLDVLEVVGQRVLGVLVLEMLLVGLGVGHLRLADGARHLETGLRRGVLLCLAVALRLLQLGLFLGVLLLGLDLLVTAGHGEGWVGSEKQNLKGMMIGKKFG